MPSRLDTSGLVFDSEAQAAAIGVVAEYVDVQPIMEVCARATGMGYCVIAHVTEDRWLACAVLDKIGFGLMPGGELPIKTTLCNQVRIRRNTIAFDEAASNAEWSDHDAPRIYGLQSYIAAPIILEGGEFFGTLCAIDPNPAPASRPDIVQMFELFAKLIANHIDAYKRVRSTQAALTDAEANAELREQFIAVLGHDLRNPLAALDAGVTMLRRRLGPDSKVGPILDEMDQSSGRMRRLINDVLDFARGRLGGGMPVVRLASTDVSAAIGLAVGELSKAYPDRIFEIEIAPDLTVAGDPDRIAQLTSNLLANAIAHGDPAKPVRIVARLHEDALELVVSNGGPAIPPDIQPRLFQPFHRGDRNNRRDGLGLGLYIAKTIAEAHHGVLTSSSDATETRFVFTMPTTAPNTPSPPEAGAN